jgi:hypothetical protein
VTRINGNKHKKDLNNRKIIKITETARNGNSQNIKETGRNGKEQRRKNKNIQKDIKI